MNNYKILGDPQKGLTGATLGFFIGFAAVTLFAPLTGYIALSPTDKGLLLSIAALTGSLFRIPFAAWVDTTGGKKPILSLLLMAFVGMLGIFVMLYSLTPEQIKEKFGLLLFFGALAGCGIATFSPGIGQTSYWFSQSQQGKALGIYAGVGNLAPGIFVLIITNILIKNLEMKTIYLLWTTMLAIGIVIYIFIGQNAWFFQLRKQGVSEEEAKEIAKEKYGQEIFPKGTVIQSLVNSAKVWQTWVMVFIYFFSFGGFLALTNWFKEFFQYYHGMTVAVAGLLTAAYSIGASLSRVFSGGIGDKIGGRKLTNIALLISLVGTLLLGTNGNFGINILGLLCMTVGMGVVNAGVFKMLPAFVPSAVGGAAGWVGGLGAFGGFVLPNITSSFLTEGASQDAGYLKGFLVYTVLVVLALVVVNILPKQQKS